MDKRGRFFTQLWFLVLIATVAGAVLGWRDPSLGAQMRPLGDAFIALIRMMIAPVIFCTVVNGIAGMQDTRRAGRVALKAIIYFEVVTTLALLFALVAVDLWQPGAGMNIDPRKLDTHLVQNYAAQGHEQTILQFLMNIVPSTFFSAFAQPQILQVLFVSVLFAFALGALGERARPVLALTGQLSQVFFRIVGFIMWVAPIGAFGAVAFTVGAFGLHTLMQLGGLVLEFYSVSLVFAALVFGGLTWLLGVSLLRLLYFIRDELLIVAATTSTETVLPRIIEKLRALGCDDSVVGLVVPAGYSFNLDGTCLYLATTAMFLAQATNTHLTLLQQLGLLAIMLLSSKGAAGVAGAAFVVLAATLSAAGTIPFASIVLILGIHRLLSEATTFVNVVGNCVATIVVAKWEHALDSDRLHAQIGLRRYQVGSTSPA
jgi:aerobic C4-dicarboxylate transport protein